MSHSLSIKTFKTSSGCNLIAFDLLLFDVPYFPGVFMMMNETHKGGKNKHLFTDSVNGIASYQLLHRFFKKPAYTHSFLYKVVFVTILLN